MKAAAHKEADLIKQEARLQSEREIGSLSDRVDEARREHQRMLDDLKKLSGKELDTRYDEIQKKAHQEAVDLFTKYSQGGDNPDLKQWAAKTLPHLKEHLAMAQKLK